MKYEIIRVTVWNRRTGIHEDIELNYNPTEILKCLNNGKNMNIFKSTFEATVCLFKLLIPIVVMSILLYVSIHFAVKLLSEIW